jgi:hypothetical protein
MMAGVGSVERRERAMLRGLTTVTYFANDVEAAAGYAQVLSNEPYFRRGADGRAASVEFRIGDYQHELGILDSRFAPAVPASGPGGPVTYWHVDDLPVSFDRLIALGATAHEEPVERGA